MKQQLNLALFLIISVVLITAQPIQNNQEYSWSSGGGCGSHRTSENGVTLQKDGCQAHGEAVTVNNGDCKKVVYDYKKITIQPAPATEDVNNGKEICTEEKCENSSGAQPVDCATALTAQQLADVRAIGRVQI